MSTELRGTLVALGTPAPTVYDAFPTESRALVHVSHDAIAALDPNLMFAKVVILAAAELDALRHLLDAARAELVIVRENWDAVNREALAFRQSVSDMLADPHKLRANILRSGPSGYDLYHADHIERIKNEAAKGTP